MNTEWRNKLYFGDNLEVLRDKIPDESVDLVYLDPPFNSNVDYNVLYQEVDGTPSAAQIRAFTDTWHWDEAAIDTYDDLIYDKTAPAKLIEVLRGLEQFLGHNAMLAYLVMMAPRLVELRRVLKPTGSIYLHCDPTASHFLKLLMDAIFDKMNFRNEIIWKRTSAHSDPIRWGRTHDVLLYYSKSNTYTWNPVYLPHSEKYLKRFRHIDPDGRRWTDDNLTAKGLRGGGYTYTYKGATSLWRVPLETMEQLDAEGRLHFTKAGGIRLKRYLDETEGVLLQDIIADIPPINSQAKERLGYPTQKPVALLERIIEASSNEGDVVLDPFCGCGTAVAAAQKLNRRWFGIDITYLAINLIKNRLADHFGEETSYEEHGIPKDWHSARELAEHTDKPRKEFELWALSLVKARPKENPEKKSGGDKGIDGVRYFIDGKERSSHKVIVQVKSDRKPQPSYVRDLRGTMKREEADIGALIFLYTPGKNSDIWSEATVDGFYHSELINEKYPRIQVLTIKGLLKKKPDRLEIPPYHDVTFKRAEKIRKDQNKQKKLDV